MLLNSAKCHFRAVKSSNFQKKKKSLLEHRETNVLINTVEYVN
jgi:hypothetical protein